MKKIDLDKIIDKYDILDFTDINKIYLNNEVKKAMVEFGKQLLELASENACGEHCTDYVDKQSILDTIKQIKYEK